MKKVTLAVLALGMMGTYSVHAQLGGLLGKKSAVLPLSRLTVSQVPGKTSAGSLDCA